MKLIGLLVLLGLISLVEGKVVNSYRNICPDFFVKDQKNQPVTPTVLVGAQYQQICQKYKNNKLKDYRYATLYETNNLNDYRYATLYDIKKKIPVYSAYKHTGCKKTKHRTWMIEPQLDGATGDEMTTERSVPKPGTHQAVNADYEGSGYDKGHLYPRCNNCDQDQEESTFTLTNAAPQKNTNNRKWYSQVEKLQKNINSQCEKNTAYVVTGVIPGNTQIGKGVTVPRYYWSAYCCKQRGGSAFISKGYKLEMDGRGGKQATYPTVSQLNTDADLLAGYGVQTFEVFGTIVGCS